MSDENRDRFFHAFSQTRGSVPIPTQQSVRCAPSRDIKYRDSTLRLSGARRCGTRVQSKRDVKPMTCWRAAGTNPYKSNVERAGALSLMMGGSNSSLQARSSCTTAAALCLPLDTLSTHTISCKHAFMMLTAHARVMRSRCCCSRPSVDQVSRRDPPR